MWKYFQNAAPFSQILVIRLFFYFAILARKLNLAYRFNILTQTCISMYVYQLKQFKIYSITIRFFLIIYIFHPEDVKLESQKSNQFFLLKLQHLGTRMNFRWLQWALFLIGLFKFYWICNFILCHLQSGLLVLGKTLKQFCMKGTICGFSRIKHLKLN